MADTGARILLAAIAEGDEDSSDLGLPPGRVAVVDHVADLDGTLHAVAIEHEMLAERCQWFAERFAVTAGDRGAKYGDIATTATPFELFPFLCCGASVYILPVEVASDESTLTRCSTEQGITHAWLPVGLCSRLAAVEKTTLRVLVTSGGSADSARRGSYELVRCWGPAENGGISTCYEVNSNPSSRSIGKPLPGSHTYVLGGDGNLLPAGVTGQLHCGSYYLERNTSARRLEASLRVRHMLDLMRDYRAGSLIYHTLKFCDTNLHDYPYVLQRFKEEKIPVLFLETERNGGNIEGAKTRIQTFIESRMF